MDPTLLDFIINIPMDLSLSKIDLILILDYNLINITLLSQKITLVISDKLHLCSVLHTQGHLKNPTLDQKIPRLLGNTLLQGKYL